MIREINEKNFKKEVLNEENVLVDFYADWCGPCKMLKPILDEISKDKSIGKIVSINIDKEEKLAKKYGIMSIPCLIHFKDGIETERSVGLITREEVEKILRG